MHKNPSLGTCGMGIPHLKEWSLSAKFEAQRLSIKSILFPHWFPLQNLRCILPLNPINCVPNPLEMACLKEKWNSDKTLTVIFNILIVMPCCIRHVRTKMLRIKHNVIVQMVLHIRQRVILPQTLATSFLTSFTTIFAFLSLHSQRSVFFFLFKNIFSFSAGLFPKVFVQNPWIAWDAILRWGKSASLAQSLWFIES